MTPEELAAARPPGSSGVHAAFPERERHPDSAQTGSNFERRRLLPKGWLLRGRGLAALLLGLLSTLFLVATLLGLSLLAGLMVDRGRVEVSPDEAATLQRLLGEAAPVELAPVELASPELGSQTLGDAGILPSMVRTRSIGPRWTIWLYKLLPAVRSTRSAFGVLVLLTLVAAVLAKLTELAARSQADRLAHEAAVKLRAGLHRQALRLNPGDLERRGRRDAESLFIGQVDRVAEALRALTYHIARDPVRLVVLTLLLLLVDWPLALLTVLPVVAGWGLLEWERTQGAATQQLAESRAQRHLRALAEALAKSRLIRGYGLESFEQEQFRTHIRHLEGELTSGERAWRWRQRLLWALAISMIALVVYLIGSHVLYSGRLFTAADGVLFLLTLGLIAATLTSGRVLPAARRRVDVIGEQINRYLDRIPEVSQAVGAKFLPPMTRNIDFQKVSYTTPGGVPLLRDFELRIPAGSMTALISIGGTERRDDEPVEQRSAAAATPAASAPPIGTPPESNGLASPLAFSASAEAVAISPDASGRDADPFTPSVRRSRDGQAALAAALLLPRFLEPQSGRVLFDGEDIAWGTLESLQEEVAFVGGDEPFFTGTVRENLDCGAGRTMPDLMEAAKTCHVHKSILRLPEGYETPLGEYGTQLEPGTAFLLGLARAAVRNPAVLIIAEPEVELSEDDKALADDAYQRLRPGRTMLFLPRRLSTLRKCDRVVLIREGQAAAIGHQRDLVAKSGLYQHWEYVTFNPIGRR